MTHSRRQFIKLTAAGSAALAIPTILPASVFGKNAPSNRIHVGAIGTGRISQGHDMPEVLNYDGARIIAVCDLDSKRVTDAKQFVEGFYSKKGITQNVQTYGLYEELLANKDIDAVIVSTPDHWHARPVIDAAFAGKDIYVQKPFSMTLEEGRQMSNVINRTGRILQIGTQQRSMEQFRLACEFVRNGRIGELKSIKVGLPIDPAGDVEPDMPVPANLNYERWLGSTPYVPYTEKRVHPQNDYSRPGWLRIDSYCLGMITGWGVHHMDIAHWGMNTEHTGPLEIAGKAIYPARGLWNVHGKYAVELKYANGVLVTICDEFPNGVRFEGTEGWIFVTRGNYSATSSDPNASVSKDKPLQASNPKLLSPLTNTETPLYKTTDHHSNWLDCVRSRQTPSTPAEVGHRSTSACIISHIAMKLGRKLEWDPQMEHFKNDDEANAMLCRPQRAPYLIPRF
jgi:hypothetical protein